MNYDKYSYLFPPRPETAIDRHNLWSFHERGWRTQAKKNGQCSVIFVAPDRTLTVMNRHKEAHKSWQPHKGTAAVFQDLPGHGWYVFVGELLHNKGVGVRDTHYLFDILVQDGEFLFGSTHKERTDLLDSLFPKTREDADSHRVIDDHTWVAKTLTDDPRAVFETAVARGDEGIVMKDPNGTLNLCLREGTNAGWQVKCRAVFGNGGF